MDAKQQYFDQLKRCGFRSFKQANKKRFELIEEYLSSGVEPEELKRLQELVRLRILWKEGRCLREQGLEELKRRLEEFSLG